MDRRRRVRASLIAAATLVAAVLALRLHDPHRHGSWGLCPFKVLTGWDCPACGGLRAVNDLTHGDLAAAWHSNALLVAAIPLVAIAWSTWLTRSLRAARSAAPAPRPRQDAWRRAAQPVLAALAILLITAFTVWRNTPWGSAFHVA